VRRQRPQCFVVSGIRVKPTVFSRRDFEMKTTSHLLELKFVSLTKKSILGSVLAASLCAVCGSVASDAHAAGYQISVGEGTFGPAGNIPYQNGIIQSYTTDPDGPLNVPQFAAFKYSPANNGINGIAGDYNVSAEASNAHGGTAHAYAFGDGGFSGFSTSVDAQRGIPYPQQGYTGASATVSYGFQLVGPSSATPVPVTFNANAYVKTVGTGVGSAVLFVYNDPYNKLVDWELVGGESYQTYPPGETIDLLPNSLYVVREMTTAYGHLPYADGPFDPTQNSGSADAFIDPTFALTGQYASLYHFEGLPDGALAGGVPEPTTWALALIGFAGLGLAGVRRAAINRRLQPRPV
jgi:PEP-CTERM motif